MASRGSPLPTRGSQRPTSNSQLPRRSCGSNPTGGKTFGVVTTGRRRRVCIPVSERTPRSRPTRAALSSRAVAFARRRRERLAGPRAVVSARRKRLRSSSDRTSSRLRFAAIDSRASVVARSRSTRAPGSSVGGVIVVGDILTSVARLRAPRYGEQARPTPSNDRRSGRCARFRHSCFGVLPPSRSALRRASRTAADGRQD